MPRPRSLPDCDDEMDNKVGIWSTEERLEMDRRFCEAMERALRGGESEMAEWLALPGRTSPHRSGR
jgi:hypothetical protein